MRRFLIFLILLAPLLIWADYSDEFFFPLHIERVESGLLAKEALVEVNVTPSSLGNLLHKMVQLNFTLIHQFALSAFFKISQGTMIPALNCVRCYYKKFWKEKVAFFQQKVERSLGKYALLSTIAIIDAISLLFLMLLPYSKEKVAYLFLKNVAWGAFTIGLLGHGFMLLFEAFPFPTFPLRPLFDIVLLVAWLSLLISLLFYALFRIRGIVIGALICVEALFLLLFVLPLLLPLGNAFFCLLFGGLELGFFAVVFHLIRFRNC